MNLKIDKKIVNIISFILVLISGLYLSSRLYFIFNKPDFEIKPAYTYIILLFIILITFSQLIINLVVKEEEIIEEIESKKDVATENENNNQKTEITKDDNTPKKEKLNTKEILSRIIPNKLPSVEEYGETLLINIAKEFEIVQGILYVKNLSENSFSGVSYYAYFSDEKPQSFKEGDTIPGQVARNKEVLQISNIPENYINVISGLGEGNPEYLSFVPVVRDDNTFAIIEMASFKKFSDEYLELFKEMGNKLSTNIYSYVKSTENIKNDKK